MVGAVLVWAAALVAPGLLRALDGRPDDPAHTTEFPLLLVALTPAVAASCAVVLLALAGRSAGSVLAAQALSGMDDRRRWLQTWAIVSSAVPRLVSAAVFSGVVAVAAVVFGAVVGLTVGADGRGLLAGVACAATLVGAISVRSAYALHGVILARMPFWDALRHSWTLTRGRFWRRFVPWLLVPAIAWWAIGGIGWLAYQEGPWSARFLTATLAVTVAVAAWHAWIDAFGTVTFRAKDAPSPAV